MATDESRDGTIWSDEENDIIVADYFAMLADELAGRSFVKSHRRVALESILGRSKKSIEWKHMNVSAALDEIGLPYIEGYRPAANKQAAIADSIERLLDRQPHFLRPERKLNATGGFSEVSALFAEAPPFIVKRTERPARLEAFVRKFDPVERDFRNRALGEKGEALVVSFEEETLKRAGRADLAKQVRWVARDDGDGAGYDIKSWEPDGRERLIEVKTTNGGARTPFFLTRNERAVSDRHADNFRLLRVYDFARTPRLFELSPPLDQVVVLETETWRASFG